MNEELKPCPFCGSKADWWSHGAGDDDYEVLIIDCTECYASMEKWISKTSKTFDDDCKKGFAELFESWNKRV